MIGTTRSVLVTGGSGFAGSWLVESLLEQDRTSRVVILDNFFNGRREHVPNSPRVEVIEVDLRDRAGLAEIFHRFRPEVVFHLAALHYIPYCNDHPAETLEVNVVGTQNVIDACREAEPAALVAASTVAVYPARDGANAEDSLLGPIDVYGISKWVNENQIERYARESGTRCAVARLSNIYGPRETNPHVIPAILEQIALGRDEIRLGNVKPKRDYIYVSDVADGLMALAERNTRGFRTYNLGTGEEHSVEQIVAELSTIAGRPLRIEVDPDRVRATDRLHLVCDMTRTRTEIGWEARHSLSSGLRALWEFAAADETASDDR